MFDQGLHHPVPDLVSTPGPFQLCMQPESQVLRSALKKVFCQLSQEQNGAGCPLGWHQRPQDILWAIILAYIMPSPDYLTFHLILAVGYPRIPQENTRLREKSFGF